jgi:hypothetical protein
MSAPVEMSAVAPAAANVENLLWVSEELHLSCWRVMFEARAAVAAVLGVAKEEFEIGQLWGM